MARRTALMAADDAGARACRVLATIDRHPPIHSAPPPNRAPVYRRDAPGSRLVSTLAAAWCPPLQPPGVHPCSPLVSTLAAPWCPPLHPPGVHPCRPLVSTLAAPTGAPLPS